MIFRIVISPRLVDSCHSDSGDVEVTPGYYTPTGPRCAFLIMDGIRRGRCLDGESMDNQPGGPVHVYPCTKRWNQFLSFGNGKDVPANSIFTTIPLHTRNRIAETGREQTPYMCLGVARRGKLDEDDWFGARVEFNQSYEDLFDVDDDNNETESVGNEHNTNTTESHDENATESRDEKNAEEVAPLSDKDGVVKLEGDESVTDEADTVLPLSDKDGVVDLKGVDSRKMLQEDDEVDDDDLDDDYPSLLYWLGKQLMATRCDNEGGVIEWAIVPFIIEEAETSTDETVDIANSTVSIDDTIDIANSTESVAYNETNTTSADNEVAGIDTDSEDEEL
jgi:hypothetical protein